MKKSVLFALLLLAIDLHATAAPDTLLNVSYDPTREFYNDFNALFETSWLEERNEQVSVSQSHGGSGTQARSVINGLQADVVTLALAWDIDVIVEQSHLIDPDWQRRLPFQSSPYTSTVVFLVRKGNPKQIRDWDDLIKPGISVITPNPKTSGGARWNYLAAYGYALKRWKGDDEKAAEFLRRLFANVPIFATGARAATTTFAQRGMGDVLITWENEAYLALNEVGKNDFEIVMPSISILAEPPVAVVDKVVDKRGSREMAESYLERLYSDEGQELAAKHFYRPRNPKIAMKYQDRFPVVPLMTIKEFGDWEAVQKKHFTNNGLFDQVTTQQPDHAVGL